MAATSQPWLTQKKLSRDGPGLYLEESPSAVLEASNGQPFLYCCQDKGIFTQSPGVKLDSKQQHKIAILFHTQNLFPIFHFLTHFLMSISNRESKILSVLSLFHIWASGTICRFTVKSLSSNLFDDVSLTRLLYGIILALAKRVSYMWNHPHNFFCYFEQQTNKT